MKKQKVLLTILAVILICAISVTGTLAYLKASTTEVKNTFVAAGGGSLFEDATGALTLNESKAVLDADTGVYTLDTATKVASNTYSVVPGAKIAKDPAVSVTKKNAVPAYLYVEVVNNTNGLISFEIADGWTEVVGADAPNGGTVYVWQATLTDDLAATPVIKNNQIAVTNVADGQTLDFGATDSVTFYAYLAQSVVEQFTDALNVFNACF